VQGCSRSKDSSVVTVRGRVGPPKLVIDSVLVILTRKRLEISRCCSLDLLLSCNNGACIINNVPYVLLVPRVTGEAMEKFIIQITTFYPGSSASLPPEGFIGQAEFYFFQIQGV
jgi:hypothetical protein